jgi:D-alanyl-D-alanine carboxypeptidase (penicillin-binding protein 5/6)
MGGSQVFLEPYEVQNVETMIKCISIASANDASVAMAEHIAGSEEEFVARMNARAKELGMNNTNFINCSGLDADNHYTTAYDIAIMELQDLRQVLLVKQNTVYLPLQDGTIWI